MRPSIASVVIALVALVALVTLAGCSKSPVGRYAVAGDATQFIELRDDGTFFSTQKNKLLGTTKLTGKYRLDGDTLTFEPADGAPTQAQLDGTTLKDADGRSFVKQAD